MKLADVFCDGMVLQREREICVFGSGFGNGNIEFCGTRTQFAANGDFRVYLPAQEAGGPYEMKITLGDEAVVVKDILIGDIYLAAGQSNMALTLGEVGETDIVEPQGVRYFREPHFPDDKLVPYLDARGWEKCTRENAGGFSAVAYYFAVKLNSETGIPVGIVSCNIGASTVDAWTSPEVVREADYRKLLEIRHNDYFDYPFNQNCWLYENKLRHLIPFAFSGVLWYQGESDRRLEEAMNYDKLLSALIDDWRGHWNDEMPFYCVQLMPHNEGDPTSSWAALREAQERLTKHKPKTYLVTLFNTGEADNIHPTKKRGLGEALANAVLNVQFGCATEYCGPVSERFTLAEGCLRIEFSHAEGLRFEGAPRDVMLIGSDGAETPADCCVEGNSLLVRLAADTRAVALGYKNAPEHNLYNSDGYLASPFKYDLTE